MGTLPLSQQYLISENFTQRTESQVFKKIEDELGGKVLQELLGYLDNAAYYGKPADFYTKMATKINGNCIYDMLKSRYFKTVKWGLNELTARLNPEVPLKILDAGCGTCLESCFLANYSAKFTITGIDTSHEILKRAKERKQKNNLHNVIIARADKIQSPFSVNSFDAVMCIDSFYEDVQTYPTYHGFDFKHFYEQNQLSEFHRVLKKNGMLFLRTQIVFDASDEFIRDSLGYQTEDWKYKLHISGFNVDYISNSYDIIKGDKTDCLRIFISALKN